MADEDKRIQGYEDGVFRNISGNRLQPLFTNAVNYFRNK